MPNIANISLIVFDVDGVLTDGGIYLNDRGEETKRFHVRDGLAIRAAINVGMKIGVVSGRSSRSVTLRVQELGIEHFLHGVHDKVVALETVCQRAGVELNQTAFVGDDLIDLPAMLRCGYAIAVADAAAEVRTEAHYTTRAPGGHAAAREAIEHILKAQNKWEQVLEHYGI